MKIQRKIVAIGGGENGRILEDGSIAIYDTEKIDKEIVSLTHKKNPHFLFIDHAFASSLEIQESYYATMKKIYGKKFNCYCQDLKSNELNDKQLVEEKIAWADIIYEGGGDTLSMINLWKNTGFDKVLQKAWQDGKVIAGISAGAVCWFNACNSDCVINNKSNFEVVPCLNWFNAFLTPHADENGRIISTKNMLKSNNLVGILLSNRSAIEIVDDKYRVLFSDIGKTKPFVLKTYWNNNNYFRKRITNSVYYKNFKELLSKK
jgi:dipeptidase E